MTDKWYSFDEDGNIKEEFEVVPADCFATPCMFCGGIVLVTDDFYSCENPECDLFSQKELDEIYDYLENSYE